MKVTLLSFLISLVSLQAWAMDAGHGKKLFTTRGCVACHGRRHQNTKIILVEALDQEPGQYAQRPNHQKINSSVLSSHAFTWPQ